MSVRARFPRRQRNRLFKKPDLSFLGRIKKPVNVVFVCGFGDSSDAAVMPFYKSSSHLNTDFRVSSLGVLSNEELVLQALDRLKESNSVVVCPPGLIKRLTKHPAVQRELRKVRAIGVPFNKLGFFDSPKNVNYLLLRIQNSLKQKQK